MNMPPTKHKLKMKPKRHVPSITCRTCDNFVPKYVETLGASEPAVSAVCGRCARCDGCNGTGDLKFVLDSGDVVCKECAKEAKPCDYCGHTGLSNDPVSICVGCNEVICALCEDTLRSDDRSCQCELV